jgi:hypothetical protein
MSDDLQIPEVPEPKPEDPEDVSWALSTAEAMWARGDHSEGIKWVRRAAEAASEAEKDSRALELAKAAADLAGLISRQASRASIDLEEVVEPTPPPVPPRVSAAPKAVSKPPVAAPPAPSKAASTAPKAPAAPQATNSPSRPPAPLPSRTSQAPGPTIPRASAVPAAVTPAPVTPAPAPSSAPTLTGTGRNKPASLRPGALKRSRKSRENLENEARLAKGLLETAPNRTLDDRSARQALAKSLDSAETVEGPGRLGNNDPTVIGNLNDLLKAGQGGAEDGATDSDRQTVLGAPPTDLKSTTLTPRRDVKSTKNGGAVPSKPAGPLLDRTAPSGTPAARPLGEQHDPRIVTSQAVRVVVWRDANGIHVAPAGTMVSSITVDAVLVALEPNADLTAWLGERTRT